MSAVPQPGQAFAGRYRIERFLARGGMGSVYVAEQVATARRVALKVLPTVPVERFEIEAKAAAWARSKHIVEVLDAGHDESSGLPFIVMELLEGQSLRELVESTGPQSLAATTRYVEQTARGLDRAHAYRDAQGRPKPIVHRDLKPDNLFLAQREAGAPVVKILDFGIAKLVSDTSSISRDICGTPLFIAYEQLLGHAVSPQTDIWALGLIAFFLLTGRSYWVSASGPEVTSAALFAEIMHAPLDPASERIRALGGQPPWPRAFDAWFARTVNRNPAERFPSAGAAAQELDRALQSRETQTSLVSAYDRTATAPNHLVARALSQPPARPPRLRLVIYALPLVGSAVGAAAWSLAHLTPSPPAAPSVATAVTAAMSPPAAVTSTVPNASARVPNASPRVPSAAHAPSVALPAPQPPKRSAVKPVTPPPSNAPNPLPDDPFGNR